MTSCRFTLPQNLLVLSAAVMHTAIYSRLGFTVPLEDLLIRGEKQWSPHNLDTKGFWEEVTCYFSGLDAFEEGITVENLRKQSSFLLWKLQRISLPLRINPTPPVASKRLFTGAENTLLLVLSVGVIPPSPKLSKFDPGSENLRQLFSGSGDLADVVADLNTSPLFADENALTTTTLEGALEGLEGVVQPRASDHLQPPTCTSMRKRRSNGSISRSSSRQRLDDNTENPPIRPPEPKRSEMEDKELPCGED